ncbi:MAG: heptosyltransferase [Pyrinomonadaceae bacterium]|jgi:ADP-heptose:LPS heptosyltransferase|nr:heptosyltransferase [Pyrinomonadaceae bacterium]
MDFEPQNILVIDFGQLGDVVLSLPALNAVRAKFPHARITVAVGKPGKQVVEMSQVADDTLVVDRVSLRDGSKPVSVWRIARLVKEVRARRFDLVIDLHSLSETNLLGFLSGARARLYGRRPTRSLDFLSNFRPRPVVEDRSKHAVDRYLDVVAPLGVGQVARVPRLPVRAEELRAVDELLRKARAGRDATLVGMFPGAGHPSRCWPLARFGELALRLENNDGVRTVVFAGPEERSLVKQMRAEFPSSAIIFDRLSIPQLAAAAARMSVFVSNDTGPMHVAASVGTPVVILMSEHPMLDAYVPPGERHRVLHKQAIAEITTGEAYSATRSALTAERATSLFAS